MCIIVVKPEGVTLTTEQLEFLWESNPHGAGFMFADNGELHVHKGILEFSQLVNKIRNAGSSRKMVLHMRYRTHGALGPSMTHPFWIHNRELAMAHNGVIHRVSLATSEKHSDTYVFARYLSKSFPNLATDLKSYFVQDLLESYVGNSRLVFMDKTGSVRILNAHLGDWHKDVWYSNQYYKVRRGANQKGTGTETLSLPPAPPKPLVQIGDVSSDQTVTSKNAPRIVWEQRGNQIVQVKKYPSGASGAVKSTRH